MHVSEIRALSDDQLLDEFEDAKMRLYQARVNMSSGELVDTNAIKKTRRDIARILTVLRERELAAQLAAQMNE